MTPRVIRSVTTGLGRGSRGPSPAAGGANASQKPGSIDAGGVIVGRSDGAVETQTLAEAKVADVTRTAELIGADADRDPDELRGGISVLVPVLDEIEHIEATVAGLKAQRFGGPVEFLLVDGGSTDGTRTVVERLASADPRFKVLDNPARHVPCALNLGLRHARGEYVARMDAHTRYPPDYLANGVARLTRGDAQWVSGPARAAGVGRWSRRVELALNTWLGVGDAAFRRATAEIEVDTGFTGILRRATLLALDGWDERSLVNEDAELAARVRSVGWRILCVPEMAAGYVPRNSLPALARQYWRYGQYRARTSRLHPESLRRSSLLAPGLVGSAIVALAPGPLRRPAKLGLASYGAVVVAASARQSLAGGVRDAVALPAVFVTMHVAWGSGFITGCLRFGLPWRAVARVARADSARTARVDAAESWLIRAHRLRRQRSLGRRTGRSSRASFSGAVVLARRRRARCGGQAANA